MHLRALNPNRNLADMWNRRTHSDGAISAMTASYAFCFACRAHSTGGVSCSALGSLGCPMSKLPGLVANMLNRGLGSTKGRSEGSGCLGSDRVCRGLRCMPYRFNAKHALLVKRACRGWLRALRCHLICGARLCFRGCVQ